VDDWNVDEDEGADVWKAEERAAFTAEAVEVTGGVAVLGKTARGMDAVAMERRERTRSSGYVVPTKIMGGSNIQMQIRRKTRTDRRDASQGTARQPFWGIEFL
jgi:hypothetical protein